MEPLSLSEKRRILELHGKIFKSYDENDAEFINFKAPGGWVWTGCTFHAPGPFYVLKMWNRLRNRLLREIRDVEKRKAGA